MIVGYINLKDKRGNKSRKKVSLKTTDLSQAQSDLALIMSMLDPLIDAEVVNATITVELDFSGQPINMQGNNLSDVALLAVSLGGSKKGTISVPAAIDGVIVPLTTVIDVAAPELQNYVATVAQLSTVSDGEEIDTTQGTGGVLEGSWRSRFRK